MLTWIWAAGHLFGTFSLIHPKPLCFPSSFPKERCEGTSAVQPLNPDLQLRLGICSSFLHISHPVMLKLQHAQDFTRLIKSKRLKLKPNSMTILLDCIQSSKKRCLTHITVTFITVHMLWFMQIVCYRSKARQPWLTVALKPKSYHPHGFWIL